MQIEIYCSEHAYAKRSGGHQLEILRADIDGSGDLQIEVSPCALCAEEAAERLADAVPQDGEETPDATE